MKVPRVGLDADDAVELSEVLEFLGGWLVSDSEHLGRSLARFVGDGYELDDLRGDIARFAFLLGGDQSDFFFAGLER